MLTRAGLESAWRILSISEPPTQKNLEKAKRVLTGTDYDWNARVEQLKVLRAFALFGPPDRISPNKAISDFIEPLEAALRDLRSQVAKEAALTISCLVSTFKTQLTTLAEKCLPTAIAQCSSSVAKVVSSSAALLSEVLVEEVQSTNIYQKIVFFTNSKDKGQRKQSAVLLGVAFNSWEPKVMKSMMRSVYMAMDSYLNDADSETRAAARKAFQILENKYPEEANKCFELLQPQKQKLLRDPSTGSLKGDSRNTPSQPKVSKQRRSLMTPTNMSARNSGSLARRRSEVSIKATGSPNIHRVKSNLGPNSFCATLSAEQATKLEEQMREAGESLSQSTGTDDDDFLLSKPVASTLIEAQKTDSKGDKRPSLRPVPTTQKSSVPENTKMSRTSRRRSPLVVAPLAMSSPKSQESLSSSSEFVDLNSHSPKSHEKNKIFHRIEESLNKMKMDPVCEIINLHKALRERDFPFEGNMFDAIYLSIMNQLETESSEECKKAALGFIRKLCLLRSMALFDYVPLTVSTIMKIADSEKLNAKLKQKAADTLMMLATHLMGPEMIDALNEQMSKSKKRRMLAKEMIEKIEKELEHFELDDFVVLSKISQLDENPN